MAKYQNMLVVIDPNQDDQPALRRAVYLHQRIGGRIKAFLPIYDFSYEMTTLLSPDERTAMRQGGIGQRTAWIRGLAPAAQMPVPGMDGQRSAVAGRG